MPVGKHMAGLRIMYPQQIEGLLDSMSPYHADAKMDYPKARREVLRSYKDLWSLCKLLEGASSKNPAVCTSCGKLKVRPGRCQKCIEEERAAGMEEP